MKLMKCDCRGLRNRQLIFALLLILALLGIYGGLIRSDPLLARDDLFVLARLHSPREWFSHLVRLDFPWLIGVTPVRDLTFMTDIATKKSLGLSTFHATSFVLWIAIVGAAWRILSRVFKNTGIAWAGAALFALHPVTVESVAWVSARKHLLAALWIFLATDFALKRIEERSVGLKNAFAIVVFYTLSLLSQPIAVLWPLWALLHWRLQGNLGPSLEPRDGARRWLDPVAAPFLACVPILIAGAVMALSYYLNQYRVFTGAPKILTGVDTSWTAGIWALALGRYFFNWAAPFRLAAIYYPGSVWNMVGLGLLCLSVAIARQWMNRRALLSWGTFALVPLVPVTVRMTNVFVSDTYELISSLGLLILAFEFALSLRRRFAWNSEKARKIALSGLGLVLVAAFAMDRAEASAWSSDARLWEYTYRVEPSPRGLSLYARYLVNDGRARDAVPLIRELEAWDSQSDWRYLFSRAIYLMPDLSVPAKIEALEREPGLLSDPWAMYYDAALHADLGDTKGEFQKSWRVFREALARPEPFGEDWPKVAAEAEYVCRRAGEKSCERIAADARRSPLWAEAPYQKRASQLSGGLSQGIR